MTLGVDLHRQKDTDGITVAEEWGLESAEQLFDFLA